GPRDVSARAEPRRQYGGGGRVPVHDDDVVAEPEAAARLRADEADERIDDRRVVAPPRFTPQRVQSGLDALGWLDGGRREQRGEVAGNGEDPGGERDGLAGGFDAACAVPAVVHVGDGLLHARGQIEAAEQLEGDGEGVGLWLGGSSGISARAPAEGETADALEHGGERQ